MFVKDLAQCLAHSSWCYINARDDDGDGDGDEIDDIVAKGKRFNWIPFHKACLGINRLGNGGEDESVL